MARLRVLYRISNILTTTQRSETILKFILKEAVKETRATSGTIVLIDRAEGVLNIEIAVNIDAERAQTLKLAVGEGVTGCVAKTGKPLLVGDVRRSPHYVNLKADVQSELAVPLIIGGETVGLINVDSDRRDAFTEDDLDLLVAIAAQSAKVMQAANFYAENRRRAERLSTIFKVAGAIVSEPILDDVLTRVADEVRGLMDARVCSIMLLDEKAEHLEIKAVSGQVSPDYINRQSIPVSDNVIGRAISKGRPLYISDVREEAQYRLPKVAVESGLCSLLSIPMIFMGRTIGVLNIYSKRLREFSEEDVGLMTAFAGHSAVAIVNAQRYERVFRVEELLRSSERFQLLGTLSAEIAHEIRNPLTILSMLVHTVQGDEALSEDSRNDLNVMDTKLKHMNRIVDQVLDFSRSRQTDPVEVDLNRVVEDVALLTGHKAAAMGRKVRKKLRSGLPAVMGDPGQLEQAVLNLALNGLEAMQERGTALHFSTGSRSRKDGDWVYLRVRDEGRGIPEEKRKEIFAPYFSMREKGTGLGLFITRRIVSQFGGTLNLKSEVGKGTRFEILLPAAGNGSGTNRAEVETN